MRFAQTSEKDKILNEISISVLKLPCKSLKLTRNLFCTLTLWLSITFYKTHLNTYKLNNQDWDHYSLWQRLATVSPQTVAKHQVVLGTLGFIFKLL